MALESRGEHGPQKNRGSFTTDVATAAGGRKRAIDIFGDKKTGWGPEAKAAYHEGVTSVANALYESRVAQAKLDPDEQARLARPDEANENWLLAENFVRAGKWSVDELIEVFQQKRLQSERKFAQTTDLAQALFDKRVLTEGVSPPEREAQDAKRDWDEAFDTVSLGEDIASAIIKEVKEEVALLRGDQPADAKAA